MWISCLASCGGGGGSVGAPANSIAYPANTTLYLGYNADIEPTVIGSASNFSVTPALPAGLSINVFTGVISGSAATVGSPAHYTVTATGQSGTLKASFSISVLTPRPTADVAAHSITVAAGDPVTISWSTTNADACSASGAWSGTLAPSGQRLVTPVSPASTYTIVCSGAGGTSDPSSATVNILAGSADYRMTFSANAVRDAAWDSARQVMYLAFASSASTNPNSIVTFDPVSGTILKAVYAGSEPNTIAISNDGLYLYVGFLGTDQIQRLKLPDLTLDSTFPFSQSIRDTYAEPFFPDQMAVSPDASSTIGVSAVSIRNIPASANAMVFDGTSPRFTQPVPGGWFAWGQDANTFYLTAYPGTIYGYDNATYLGLTAPSGTVSFETVYGVAYQGGLLYDGVGGVFNAADLSRAGTLQTPGLVAADPGGQQFFVASYDSDSGHQTLSVYDRGSLVPRETVTPYRWDDAGSAFYGPRQPRRIIRWGSNGLAIVDGSGLALMSGSFVVASTATTVPGVIPGTTNEESRSVRYISATTHVLPLQANDIVWAASLGKLLATIPMTASDHPNSIAVVDPATGKVSSYVPTDAEPGALAVTDDNQYLYVATAGTLERFKLPALTLDASVARPNGVAASPGVAPQYMDARPGDPQTVALSGRNVIDVITGMAENSMAREDANVLRWSSDGGYLYGIDSAGEPPLLWRTAIATNVVTDLGSPLTYPYTLNAGYPLYMAFHEANGLIYGDTGAVYDPATKGWPGTLPLTLDSGRSLLDNGVLATLHIDPSRNRVYAGICESGTFAECGTEIVVFNTSNWLPLVAASAVDQSSPDEHAGQGWPLRLEEMSPTSIAILAADKSVVLMTAPELGL